MATAPPSSDAVLATRLRERDRTAWDDLYREYGQRLYRFSCRLTGNEHDAADLVQEAFVRVLTRLDRLDADRPDLSSYLFKTAQNLFLRGREQARRVEAVEEVPEPREPMAIEDDPQRATLLQRQQEEVRVANGRLAPRQRLVLALCELEDKSYAEIGELVGINENAVAQLISRARQSLRHELRLVQVDRSRLPEECQRLLPQLSAYLDGQLKEPKKGDVLAHVLGCEHCQRALADMREASRRYRALIPPLAVAGALKEGIDDALASAGFWETAPAEVAGSAARRFALASRSKALLLVTATGVVALAVAGGAYLALRGADETPADGRAEAAAIVEAAELTGPGPVATEPAQPAPATVADDQGPDVTIQEGPPAETRARDAQFVFAADEPGSAFVCRLDEQSAQECASPASYEGLGVGPHAFRVSATDAAGNEGQAAAYGWVVVRAKGEQRPGFGNGAPDEPATTDAGGEDASVSPAGATPESPEKPKKPEKQKPADTTPPTITGLTGPPSPTRKTVAVFRWGTSEPVSQVECSLDGGGWSRCYTPTRVDVGIGSHTFCVRATDRAKNVGEPACYSWTVEEPPPPPPETQPPPPETTPEPPSSGPGPGITSPPEEPAPGAAPADCPPTAAGPPPPGCERP